MNRDNARTNDNAPEPDPEWQREKDLRGLVCVLLVAVQIAERLHWPEMLLALEHRYYEAVNRAHENDR